MFLKTLTGAPPESPAGAGTPGTMPGIWYLFGYKPDATRHLERFTEAVMRGPSPLSPGLRELIAAFTSRRNACVFWTGSHAAVAAELLGSVSLVRAVLDDHRTAAISEAERALFDFVERVTERVAAGGVPADEVARLHDAGWSDEAVYDAITVCALFQFYNTWVDGSGVQGLSEAGFAASGRRLATAGYLGIADRAR